jgi:mono/diheme cytochrome c family protein
MRYRTLALSMGLAVLLGAGLAATRSISDSVPYVSASTQLEAGRYLVVMGGCNGCHTADYLQTEGKVPEAKWLEGNPVGFQGPWGITYPANLRTLVPTLSEQQWVALFRAGEGRPPMPWMDFKEVNSKDLGAIHAYIKHLGAAGKTAPDYVPPGKEPVSPYYILSPQQPKGASRGK